VARHDFGPRATTIPGDLNPSTAKTPRAAAGWS